MSTSYLCAEIWSVLYMHVCLVYAITVAVCSCAAALLYPEDTVCL